MAEVSIGIVGTGFIGTHFAMSVDARAGYTVERVLTRRDVRSVSGVPEEQLTDSISELIGSVDVIVECSGDPLWATEVVTAAVERDKPVVTMNTEFHITTGSSFVGRGLVTEAAGDQPGVLAELHEDARAMGFDPVIYGNMKGFLNPDPSPEDMKYWGDKQGISLPMVTSFTDGTKVQAEQVLVANHFGATLACEGMLGPAIQSLDEGVRLLIEHHEQSGKPISDFIVGSGLPHGVFIVATHDERQGPALEYFKLGPGPYYTLIRNNIFVHLEILKTVDRVLRGGGVLLDNSPNPSISLAAVPKRPLAEGQAIANGIGSFDLRGRAVLTSDHPNHVPIGLIRDAVVSRELEPSCVLTFDDLELPDSLAREVWQDLASSQ